MVEDHRNPNHGDMGPAPRLPRASFGPFSTPVAQGDTAAVEDIRTTPLTTMRITRVDAQQLCIQGSVATIRWIERTLRLRQQQMAADAEWAPP